MNRLCDCLSIAAFATSIVLMGCGRDAQTDKISAIEARLAKVEASLSTLPPGPSPTAQQTLSDLEKRIAKLEGSTNDSATTLKAAREPLTLDGTGNEVCARKGKVCLAVIGKGSSELFDANHVPCGYMVADCNSRVVNKPHCLADQDYLASPIKFWKSPGTKGQCGTVADDTCLRSPSDLTAICME